MRSLIIEKKSYIEKQKVLKNGKSLGIVSTFCGVSARMEHSKSSRKTSVHTGLVLNCGQLDDVRFICPLGPRKRCLKRDRHRNCVSTNEKVS